jgi:rare lipoprotein A
MNKIIKITLLVNFIIFNYNKGEENIFKVKKLNKSSLFNTDYFNYKEYQYDQIHNATWYNLHGHRTASGQIFHRDSLTAAYNNAEFGTYIKVTNISNNESIIVKVTDRMGCKTPNRIDLSLCAFDSISSPSKGRLKVKLDKIEKPLN